MGIVSSMRRHRYQKKAAYKAAKVQAKHTAKATAKRDRTRDRYLRRTASKIRAIDAKAAKQQNKRDTETAKALVAQAKARRITGRKVLGWVGAARVIIPVAAPLVYRALAKLGTAGGGVSAVSGHFGGGRGADAGYGPDAVQRARIANIRNRAGARAVPDSTRSEILRKLATLETSLDSAANAGSGSAREKILAVTTTELDRLDSQLTEVAY